MNDPNRPEDKSRGAQSSETGASSSGASAGDASSPGQTPPSTAAGTDEGQGGTTAAPGSTAGGGTTAAGAGQASSSPQGAASSTSSAGNGTAAAETSSSSSSGEAAEAGAGSSSDGAAGEGDGSEGGGDGGSPPPPEPRSRFTLWFAILLLAGGIGGVGWLTYNTQQDLRQARQQFDRLEAIDAEVEQALGRVKAQAEAAESLSAGDELQALRSRLSELESRSESTASTVATLEEQLGTAPDSQRLSELESQLESTAGDLSELQERIATLAEEQGAAGAGVGEERLQELQEQLSGRIDELAASQEQISSRVEELATGQEQMGSRLEEVAAGQEQMGSQLERLGSRDPAEEQGWVKAEAGYLAQIAIDRVRHHHDVDSALAALRDADELLAEISGEGIDERKAVGEAIDALLDYSGPETGEIRQRIVAQIEGIDQLSLGTRPEAEDAPQLPELQADAEDGSGWQKAANRVWERLQKGLGDLVRIQREDGAARILAPDQRYFIRESLRLQLEGALMALSSGNAEAYRSGLERAATWLQDHFDSEAPAVTKAAEELNALAEEPITHDPPEIAPILEPVKPF